MRISVVPGDPGFRCDTDRISVYLDGALCGGSPNGAPPALTADDKTGEVLCLVLDATGLVQLAYNGEPLTELRFGQVRIVET